MLNSSQAVSAPADRCTYVPFDCIEPEVSALAIVEPGFPQSGLLPKLGMVRVAGFISARNSNHFKYFANEI